MQRSRFVAAIASSALAAVLAMYVSGIAGASSRVSSGSAQPLSKAKTQKCGTDTGTGCAPTSDRVDLGKPSFSNPTAVMNPLHPTRDLHSEVLLGNIDGHPFRVEITLLPKTKMVRLNGQDVETIVPQYVAFLDGRIEEVALDRYAQADDGAVWYLGEDVYNYRDGVVANTEGTWLAGKDGPPAMIMPADPRVGDVYRSENIPGLVFEEITVRAIDQTVAGPHGPVVGALVVQELHQEGTYEEKIFAPGYGEFWTGAGGDLEALALAVPTDALSTPTPSELETLLAGATTVFEAAGNGNWPTASATLGAMHAAWFAYRAAGDVPALLEAQMSNALENLTGDALTPAVEARNQAGARKAAIDVALAGLDLELRHRPPAEVDLARFDLWARQVLVDAAAPDDPSTVTGDVATLEWIRDRIIHTFDATTARRVDKHLRRLRAAADKEDLVTAAAAAGRLRDTLARSSQH